MISKDQIKTQIEKIPAIPKFVKLTLDELNKQDITKASSFANQDLAFINYLKSVVNKPIFGFVNEINEPKQIFTILGISKSIQVIYTYLISLITPKKWKIFHLDIYKFQKIQLNLMHTWGNILKSIGLNTKENLQIITLIPYTFILVENIFKAHSEDIKLLQAQRKLDFNKILIRTSGYDVYDLSVELAKIWELPQMSIDVLQTLKSKNNDNNDVLKMAKYIHLALFYELSSVYMSETGLNSFIEFDIDFILSIEKEFKALIDEQNEI